MDVPNGMALTVLTADLCRTLCMNAPIFSFSLREGMCARQHRSDSIEANWLAVLAQF